MDKKLVRFLSLLLVFGLVAGISFSLALDGQRTSNAPDWSFHLCYAKTLNAGACASYTFYAPLVHVSAFVLSLVGVPVGVSLAFFLAISFVCLAFLLLKHGGTMAFALYFIALPYFFTFVLQKAPYLWVDLAYSGLVPFVVLVTLGLFLLLEWKQLPVWARVVVLFAMLVVHNSGFLLAGLVIASLIAADLFKAGWLKLAFPIAVCFVAAWLNFGDYATRLFVFLSLCFSLLFSFVWRNRNHVLNISSEFV